MKRFLLGLACLGVLAGCGASPVAMKEKFPVMTEATGVTMYAEGGEYVQRVRPSEGASLHLLLGKESASGSLELFERRNIAVWFKEWSSTRPRAFSAVNAQFFDAVHPVVARLAFSVKTENRVHAGYGDAEEYRARKLVFAMQDGRYGIFPYDDRTATLERMAQPDAIVGLRPEAPASPDSAVGRTYIGIDTAGNAVIFSSPSSTRSHAETVLLGFGVPPDTLMMLDGGPSAQLVRDGTVLVSSRAPPSDIPVIIGIEAGP